MYIFRNISSLQFHQPFKVYLTNFTLKLFLPLNLLQVFKTSLKAKYPITYGVFAISGNSNILWMSHELHLFCLCIWNSYIIIYKRTRPCEQLLLRRTSPKQDDKLCLLFRDF